MGWTPGTMMQDIPVCFPVPLTDPNGQPHVDSVAPACKGYYVPHDYDAENFLGKFPVRYALGNSLNIPATEALSFVGDSPSTADSFLAMAQRLGITKFNRNDMGPTTALGTQVMPLSQLTGAYATIANSGRRAPLQAILKIEGPDGSVLYPTPNTPKTPPTYQVLSPQVAYMMTSALTDNSARFADFGKYNPLTWSPDGNSTIALAAKTGTSSGSTGPVDIVTVGYTPFMTLGVWIGNANGKPMSNGIGISGAGYVFHDAMVWAKDHYKWPDGAQFPVPPGMGRADFNCDTGLAPYQGQKDMTCPFSPYPGTAQKKDLYVTAGANLNVTTGRPNEDWYIKGQAPLQS
jgi:membrane peptidoglycan carboxypeptidase